MSYILGLNCSGFHSSACLLRDGQVAYAVAEERISRIKQDSSFPLAAVRYCCEAEGIELEDVSHVFVGWNPRFYLSKSDRTLAEAFRSRGKLAYLALNELGTLAKEEILDLGESLGFDGRRLEIRFVDHHKAHLANGFLQSGFDRADFLVLDGFGELSTGFCGTATREGIETFESIRTPHSLGSFYSAFADHLGFRPNRDEWKVMALAALGDPEPRYEAVRSLIRVRGLGLELDLSFFEHFLFFTQRHFTPKFVERFGPPVGAGEELEQRHFDLVAAVQRVAEETVFELLGKLHERTGGEELVVGGGFFMNSVCNGKLTDASPYKTLFVGGSPDDSGVSVGSALYGAHYELQCEVACEPAAHNYFGRTYAESDIRRELERRKLAIRELDDPAGTAAELIGGQGKIVAWFQGASEFGQRALGNRSILADPTAADVKDRVNSSVKYREWFRPFAPSVLRERQAELFPEAGRSDSYFMEKVFRFDDAWGQRVPAVTHFDGSGRLHTVDREINPLFHRLIEALDRRLGAPVVLNTSFNTNGVPLVESPGDAIACFYDSGLDALILDRFLVEK